jgi:hypothetical protein
MHGSCTYLSFIRFSHSVFALPFADWSPAGVAAGAVRMAADPLGDYRDGLGAQRLMKLQPPRRCADGRVNPRTAMREIPTGIERA